MPLPKSITAATVELRITSADNMVPINVDSGNKTYFLKLMYNIALDINIVLNSLQKKHKLPQ